MNRAQRRAHLLAWLAITPLVAALVVFALRAADDGESAAPTEAISWGAL